MRIEPSFLFDLGGTLVDSVYSACSCLLLVWHIHRKIGMSGSLFTNQLLRETAVEIDPERVERLQRAHARAYQQYSVQMIGDQLVADQAGRETRRCHHVEPVRPAKSSRRRRSFLSGKFMRATVSAPIASTLEIKSSAYPVR